MTHVLHLQPDARVLEVGTGSGYQCAILAELAAEVVTIETIEALGHASGRGFRRWAIATSSSISATGAAGWPDKAPYDAILVTAAAPSMPPRCRGQLKPGGRLVIPVGRGPFNQDLVLVEKDAAGRMQADPVPGRVRAPAQPAAWRADPRRAGAPVSRHKVSRYPGEPPQVPKSPDRLLGALLGRPWAGRERWRRRTRRARRSACA